MKNKLLIFTVTFTVTLAKGFSQDSSAILTGKPNKEVVSPAPASDAPHATINTNTGVALPATTTGTMNSTVNPNTQFVIPIHKSKSKSNAKVTTQPGIIVPGNNGTDTINSRSTLSPKK